jgi:hypothetical protein
MKSARSYNNHFVFHFVYQSMLLVDTAGSGLPKPEKGLRKMSLSNPLIFFTVSLSFSCQYK